MHEGSRPTKAYYVGVGGLGHLNVSVHQALWAEWNLMQIPSLVCRRLNRLLSSLYWLLKGNRLWPKVSIYILTDIVVQVLWKFFIIFLKLVTYFMSPPKIPFPDRWESSVKIIREMKFPRVTEWTAVQVVNWPNLPFLLYSYHLWRRLYIFYTSIFFCFLFFPQSSGHQLIPFLTSLLSEQVMSLLLKDQFCPHARWDNSMRHMLSNPWSNMVGTWTQAGQANYIFSPGDLELKHWHIVN